MRALIIAVFVALFAAGPAAAEYSYCNKTSYAVSSAIGFIDGDRLATRGWWRLRPGECKVVLTDQTKPGRYFVFAEAIPGHRGSVRTWSGDTQLCVEEQGFFTVREQDSCAEDARRRRAFIAVEVKSDASGGQRTEFVEANNYTVYSAEVAGVQRLLKDLGFEIERIDGDLGQETIRAMRDFQTKAGLEQKTAIDDTLLDALIESANEQERKLGMFYCNEARTAAWAAIAEPREENVYRARGWWRIGPEECVKVIKGPLASDHYYVYAELEEAEGDRPLTGGEQPLCVNAVLFDIADHDACGEAGLETASFRRLEIGNANSWTYRFQAEAFGPVRIPTRVTRGPDGEAAAEDEEGLPVEGEADAPVNEVLPADAPAETEPQSSGDE